MKIRSDSPLGLYTVGVAALFLTGFFLLVVFGAQSYRNTVLGQSGNNDTRALLSYLATAVRAGDERGSVRVVHSAAGTELCLDDGDTGFTRRIYLSDGVLVEEYARIEAARGETEAYPIGPTSRFDVETPDGGTLRIFTDAGETLVHLRSEGGVA